MSSNLHNEFQYSHSFARADRAEGLVFQPHARSGPCASVIFGTKTRLRAHWPILARAANLYQQTGSQPTICRPPNTPFQKSKNPERHGPFGTLHPKSLPIFTDLPASILHPPARPSTLSHPQVFPILTG